MWILAVVEKIYIFCLFYFLNSSLTNVFIKNFFKELQILTWYAVASSLYVWPSSVLFNVKSQCNKCLKSLIIPLGIQCLVKLTMNSGLCNSQHNTCSIVHFSNNWTCVAMLHVSPAMLLVRRSFWVAWGWILSQYTRSVKDKALVWRKIMKLMMKICCVDGGI